MPGPTRLFALVAILAFVLAALHGALAETFRFESETSLKTYSAKLSGDLAYPVGRGPFPVVILLHACGGLDRWGKASLGLLAREFNKNDFATYILDSFSARNLTAETVCDRRSDAVEFRLDDLFNAKAALQKLPGLQGSNYFAVGQSHGGSVAILAAVNSADRPPFRALGGIYPDCRVLLHGLKIKSPVLILAADKDDWTPSSVCERAKDRERPEGSKIDLTVFSNAHHGFDQDRPSIKFKGHILEYSKAATSSRKSLVEFFKQHLGRD
ncbi:dienelactone hydrolase family protein [Tardiphaga sp. 866_E4_N2_1]|uniref:dienelactone hydrolase family protein n=1 Tax=unclassified Tardiphaga TaxID=2631404 RepID=UPI003F1F8EA3